MDKIGSIAVIGKNGLLGSAFCTSLDRSGATYFSFSSQDLDILSPSSIKQALSLCPNLAVVINCAAYTQVDMAETEMVPATQLNTEAPAHLARYCDSSDLVLVHFSTDYVFNGQQVLPYRETDLPDPINFYGRSKWQGEQSVQYILKRHYIFRIQWLYGPQGSHFVSTMLRLAETRASVSVVDNQFGSPSYSLDIAAYVLDFLRRQAPFGTYHLANSGYCSWFEFACEIFRLKSISVPVHPVSEYPLPAKRPSNGRLDIEKFGLVSGQSPRSWQMALAAFLS